MKEEIKKALESDEAKFMCACKFANAPTWLQWQNERIEQLEQEVKELQESHRVTNADYKALTDIMDRARNLAYQTSEAEEKPVFKMVDGVLTRIEDQGKEVQQ